MMNTKANTVISEKKVQDKKKKNQLPRVIFLQGRWNVSPDWIMCVKNHMMRIFVARDARTGTPSLPQGLPRFPTFYWDVHSVYVRAIIINSWFETALDYKPRFLDLKIDEFPSLVHKLSVTLTLYHINRSEKCNKKYANRRL